MVVIQGDYENAIRYCDKITDGAFFEFDFSYVDLNERFRELDRFIWESKHTLRFQNEYRGNVIVELSGWNDKSEYEFNEYFDAFMYYLKSKGNMLNVAFFVNGKCSRALFNCLSRFYEIHLVEPEKGEVSLQTAKVQIGFNSREE